MYPWTSKPWKMKVAKPNIRVITPKNEGTVGSHGIFILYTLWNRTCINTVNPQWQNTEGWRSSTTILAWNPQILRYAVHHLPQRLQRRRKFQVDIVTIIFIIMMIMKVHLPQPQKPSSEQVAAVDDKLLFTHLLPPQAFRNFKDRVSLHWLIWHNIICSKPKNANTCLVGWACHILQMLVEDMYSIYMGPPCLVSMDNPPMQKLFTKNEGFIRVFEQQFNSEDWGARNEGSVAVAVGCCSYIN